MRKTLDLRTLKREHDSSEVEAKYPRPQTRSECENGIRPCPYVGCKYNLFLDVTPAGSIKFNFPGREPEEMPADESCTLDVADRMDDTHREMTAHTLEYVGGLMNLTRERARQLLRGVRQKLKAEMAEDL